MVAKQKWKNLRDTFRVELKKTKRYSGLDASDPIQSRSLWAYYEDMYFLKDILRTRRVNDFPDGPTTSEIAETLNENVKIENDSEIAYSPSANIEEETENSSNFVIGNVTSLHPQSDDADTTHEHTMKRVAKKRKSESGEGNDDDQDDDLLFFRSLLPFVKRLDQDKKLLFRMNVQQMLYNQLYSNWGRGGGFLI